MKKLLSMAAGITMAATVPANAVEIEVGYPYSALFDVTFEKIMPLFNAQHPDITVKFRATYENYEDGTNIILRESVAGDLPDVTLQGLNRQLALVEKGIAKSLEGFIADEPNFEKSGYHEAMLALGTFDGEVHGLPFAVSTPIGYYNMDLLKAAGVDSPPTTWEGVIDTCMKINASSDKDSVWWGWSITGNWFFQAVNWSGNNPVLADGKVNFDNEHGLRAFNLLNDLVKECGMRNFSNSDASSAFAAGDIGMFFWSTSSVGSIERSVGDFEFVTAPFPSVQDGGGLPAGGNAAMLTSTSDDPAKIAAAWTFLKFITSGEGAAAVAQTTGYVPPNKSANEIILADFYSQYPRKATAVKQLPLIRDWIAYPGDNGLAITQVIYDAMEAIVTGDADDMEELLSELSEEVSDLLP
jgi:multiple sugar transport system substrate-binding protein